MGHGSNDLTDPPTGSASKQPSGLQNPGLQTQNMRSQYGDWPYPKVPLLASLPSTHPFELHCDWLWDRSGSGPAPKNPRIWIAGCGTFQPYAFGVANPDAEIVAGDLSEPSLRIAERRCRWHGQKNITFAPVDLADESTWPEGEFDLIECYGVLMNLADPAGALRGLRSRLTKRGVLRLMVYPHWSRSRVFQIQRLARLLGLHSGDRSHPGALRAVIKSLPRSHPLRYAFTSYHDSKNDAGIVDAFLHAGDRGFTAFELGSLLQTAGLEPAHWFHRPWGQPDVMAERLGLADRSQTFVLNYLDLWHELRSNFIVCARRTDAPAREQGPERPHPMFAGSHSLRHRLRLSRLQLLGGRVPTRTGDGQVVLKPRDARALTGNGQEPLDRLRRTGLVLGGEDHGSTRLPHEDFPGDADFVRQSQRLRTGRRAPNPLYSHLFAAFELAERHPELGLKDLESQIGTWLPWADPLEERPTLFGLTPYGSYTRLRHNIQEHLDRAECPTAPHYGAVRLRNDSEAIGRARAFVRSQHFSAELSDTELRELWVLLFGHESLFLTLE
ncbi:MAG: class I SAM-dependent methyltransferase [bacterium]|nr:class I SAM-dependent methyltransferase [bacterium]